MFKQFLVFFFVIISFSGCSNIWLPNLTFQNRKFLKRLLYGLEMEMREQNRNNKHKLGNRAIWLVYWTDTNVHGFFGWLSECSGEKTLCLRTFLKSIDTLLWRHTATWLANQKMPSPFRVFFGRKMKSQCFDLFIHWLMKQITNT